MKNFVLLLFLLMPGLGISQQGQDSNQHRQKADSIVAFFLGDEIFKHSVRFNTLQRKTSGTLFYQYDFVHPKFFPESFTIAFALDSAGQVVADERKLDLFRIEQITDSSWVTAKQALNICSSQAHRIKKKSLRLACDPINVSFSDYERTHNLRDIVPGDLVWKVDGEVIFRGEKYSGTFEIDVFTGHVTRRFAIPWD